MIEQVLKKYKIKLPHLHSPSNYRNITEWRHVFSLNKVKKVLSHDANIVISNVEAFFKVYTWVIIGMSSVVFVLLIFVQAKHIADLLQQKKDIVIEKQRVLGQMWYWQDITQKYKGYRDGYFQLAVLAYKLGNWKEANMYVQEALKLDPNFDEGRKLERLLK